MTYIVIYKGKMTLVEDRLKDTPQWKILDSHLLCKEDAAITQLVRWNSAHRLCRCFLDILDEALDYIAFWQLESDKEAILASDE